MHVFCGGRVGRRRLWTLLLVYIIYYLLCWGMRELISQVTDMKSSFFGVFEERSKFPYLFSFPRQRMPSWGNDPRPQHRHRPLPTLIPAVLPRLTTVHRLKLAPHSPVLWPMILAVVGCENRG